MTNQSWVTWISRVQISVPPSIIKMDLSNNLELMNYAGVLLGSLQVSGPLFYSLGITYSSVKAASKMIIGTDQRFDELYSKNLQDFLSNE